MYRKPIAYVVKVLSLTRGRKVIVKREFTDYDLAQEFLDHMEAQYGAEYIVEFDTDFGNAFG